MKLKCSTGLSLAAGIVFAAPFSLTSHGQSECPYSMIGDRVAAAYSVESWDSIWQSLNAPKLGDSLLEGFWEDFVPSLVQEIGDATAERELAEKLEETTDNVNWSSLRGCRFSFLLWYNEELAPRVTVLVECADSEVDSAFGALNQILSLPVRWFPDVWVYHRETERSVLRIKEEKIDSDFSDFPVDPSGNLVSLEKRDGKIWLTLAHSAQEALEGPGLAGRDGFNELWGLSKGKGQGSYVLDFTALSDWLKPMLSTAFSPWESSVIFDETAEEILRDDPEVYEKLKKVEQDFSQLSGSGREDSEFGKAFSFLSEVGIVVGKSFRIPDGVEGTTVWRPQPGTDTAALFEIETVQPGFLSLFYPDSLETTLCGLPDLGKGYRLLLEIVRESPFGEDLLAVWEEQQAAMDFHVEKDLLPALGRQLAWIGREKGPGAAFGSPFPGMGSAYFLVTSIQDSGAAERVLERAHRFLGEYDIAASSDSIADVSFSRVDMGLLGSAAWALIEEPPIFMLTTDPDSDFLPQLLDDLKRPQPDRIKNHPEWERFATIYPEAPTSLVYHDLSKTWSMAVAQIKGIQMMVAMMGAAEPSLVSLIGLGTELMTGIPAPDFSFNTQYSENGLYIGRSLLLFPSEEPSEGE